MDFLKNELLENFSQAIFKRHLFMLKKQEREFVKFQEKQYRKYQDAVRAKALMIMGKKQLNSREYKIIKEWFIKVVPLHIVWKSMDACLETQRVTGRAIYSLAFFKCHVTAEFRYYLRKQVGGRYFVDPWSYDEWRTK